MNDVRKIVSTDEEYPSRLRDIPDSPKALWVQGTGSLNPKKAVAIVGTRSPFYKAMEVTQMMARLAGATGCTVVSGYATGVDTFAHVGAANADASTIAVLGSGILRKEPVKLALERYVLSNGLFVSELEDGNTERAYEHLMARDRITSGLADIVVVVETDAAGGAVHTAGLALKQGRRIYAVVWSQHKKYRGLAECLGSDALVQAGIAEPLPIRESEEELAQSFQAILAGL